MCGGQDHLGGEGAGSANGGEGQFGKNFWKR